MSDLDDELFEMVARRPAKRAGGARKKKAAAALGGDESDGEGAEVAEMRAQIGWVGEFGDGYGEDLLGDETDRAAFAGMGEVDREMLLEDRRGQRRALNDRLNILLEGRARERGEAVPQRGTGSARGKAAKEGTKAARAEELAAIREKRAADAARGPRGGAKYRRDSESEEGSEWSEGEGAPARRRPGDSDEDYDDAPGRRAAGKGKTREAQGGRGRGGRVSAYDSDEEDEDDVPEEPVEVLKDLLPGWIGRAMVLKWLHYPDLDKIMRGAFVRVFVGMDKGTNEPVFKIAEVAQVSKAERKYKVRELKHEIDTVLSCSIAGRTREVKLMHVSDKIPVEIEFREFRRVLEKSRAKLPSRHLVAAINARLKGARNKVWTAEEVKHVVGQRNAIRGENPYKRKQKLRLAVAEAREGGDIERLRRLEAELEEVEMLIQRMRNNMIDKEKSEKLSRVNKRHKGANLGGMPAAVDEYFGIHEVDAEAEDGDKGDAADDNFNPFMRRPTRSVNYAALGETKNEDRAAAMLGGGADASAKAEAAAEADAKMDMEVEEEAADDPNDPWAPVRRQFFRELDEEFKNAPTEVSILHDCPKPRCANTTEMGRKLFSEGFGKVMSFTFDFDLDVPVEMPPPIDKLADGLFYPPMSNSPASNLRERNFGRTISLDEYRERLAQAVAQAEQMQME